MNKDDINNINDKLKYSSPQEVLSWAVSEIGCDNIAFATSLGAEDQVLTHILRSMKADVSIFTIDTGCLYAESHDLIQETESLYDFKYEILTPESYAVEEMINIFLFFCILSFICKSKASPAIPEGSHLTLFSFAICNGKLFLTTAKNIL